MSELASALESSLLRGAGFRHGFATRKLDFRPPSAHAVEALGLVLRIDPAKVYQVSQVHGAVALLAEGDPQAMLSREADALVATEPGVAVGVRVADCVPVLLAHPETRTVAAVHAGWRGMVAGVIENAIEVAQMKGGVGAIGPCIGACCFEVDLDVADRIGFIDRKVGSKAYVDLRKAVRARLRSKGIEHVEDVPGCTKCDPDRFFSHRRDHEAAGRHLAVIACR
jgi:polyphenol oxidase